MRIAITGSSGKMGQALIKASIQNKSIELVAALDRTDSALIGQDAGAFLGYKTGIILTDNLDEIKKADCLIDFTRPEGTLKHLQFCLKHNTHIVIGSTGFNTDELSIIKKASENIAIVHSSNMSIGVNVTFKLIEMAAKMLNNGYDAEIFEAHHKDKIDSPSGTSITMGETISSAWNVSLSEVATWNRHGNIGARKPGTIGFSVLRGGDIVGDHSVYFCGTGERIEITHRASSRDGYANGAIHASIFLKNKKNGYYNMRDVLNLNQQI
ncbi:dihydrodipicolinate reductase [Candidatus Kinetoplastibacterium desouzaii TCC079E]|uniref:4-hydroxy-tetrahydrodipicolinate reductase n=1 Tax=Candidatus Kinetoplastidibacterium desouzai TCC079E TaxID=1208919 RepID=M1M4D7_9PROT|nr:4-hydroxy-tetrahydrodipicolinate reductase [Candidatus Kinetoplastibacterium desouzaii]AGF47080.1 dihydrodipicolinate reductase [Candidatus Kinetoplastibacterium desouzaii TCC079E]